MRITPGVASFEVNVSFLYDAEVLPGDSDNSWELVDDETAIIYDYLKDIPGIDMDSVQIEVVPYSEQDFDE